MSLTSSASGMEFLYDASELSRLLSQILNDPIHFKHCFPQIIYNFALIYNPSFDWKSQSYSPAGN